MLVPGSFLLDASGAIDPAEQVDIAAERQDGNYRIFVF